MERPDHEASPFDRYPVFESVCSGVQRHRASEVIERLIGLSRFPERESNVVLAQEHPWDAL